MIKVRYNRADNRVTVQGHAGAAPKGEDLICSAASILVHTLAANVGYMERSGAATQGVAEIKEGFAKVSCKAVRGYENTVASIFQAVCVGFEILADKYPENISFILIPE